jgi:hypothetical protein
MGRLRPLRWLQSTAVAALEAGATPEQSMRSTGQRRDMHILGRGSHSSSTSRLTPSAGSIYFICTSRVRSYSYRYVLYGSIGVGFVY